MNVSKIISELSTNTSSYKVYVITFESPVGTIIAAADNDYLYLVSFEDAKNLLKSFDILTRNLSCKYIEDKNGILQKLEKELSDYFAGKLKEFTVPLKFFGSEFQHMVWNQLLKVTFGSTQTYGDLAMALGRTASHSRAIGAACGANPLPIVVPCHRIVASSEKGGGYSCGIDRKNKLLQHEQEYA